MVSYAYTSHPTQRRKNSKCTFSEVMPSFGNLLLNNRNPNAFIFCFQMPCLFFLQLSPILSCLFLSPKYLHLVSLLFHWVHVYLTRGAAAWLAGWAALPAPELVLSSKNNSGDHDYINRWRWKYTCRGSFYLQTLLSLLCNSRSRWKWFSHQGILHTTFYPNTIYQVLSKPGELLICNDFAKKTERC